MSYSGPPILTVTNLSKRYTLYDKPSDRLWDGVRRRAPKSWGVKIRGREFVAVDNVSFEMRRGETIGIIGRNGSGKSTLLQMICGVLTPSGGQLQLNGRISALLELGAGFNPEFTGRENVLLAGSILGLSQAEVLRLMPEIEAFAEIGTFVDQPVNTYSSGMYVRLAFALAIHVSPEILVVDEALAVGDTAFQTKCLTRIRDLQDQGVTIILVTHSSNVVAEYCDRAIYLRHGKMMGDGPARDILALYHEQLVRDEGGEAKAALDVVKAEDPEAVQAPAPVKPEGVTILSVDITDPAGNERASYEVGDPLEVRITFETAVTIEKFCAGVEIKSTSDIVLWTGTTDGLRLAVESIAPGRHCIVWKFNCNAAGNRYVVAAGIGDMSSGSYKRLARLAYAGHFDIAPRFNAGSGWIEPEAKVAFIGEV